MSLSPNTIPVWYLYGENSAFPDLLHIEKIASRARGLNWRIAPHRHLHLHQIFLFLSGQVRMSMDGVAIVLQEPCIANVPAGVVHGFDFPADVDGFVLTLPTADFPEVFGAASDLTPQIGRTFHGPAGQDLVRIFTEIGDLHTSDGRFRRLRLRSEALALCCTVAETSGSDPGSDGPPDPRIAQFERLIRTEIASGWSVARFAKELSLSERHLRRICQDSLGRSAQDVIVGVKLREACRLLAYTRLRVQDVGFALGYDDPAYFGRVFQRSLQMSPGEYRTRLAR